MIYPKIIRGYKATPHKIVRNVDGEWYESRPTKKIWPAGSDYLEQVVAITED